MIFKINTYQSDEGMKIEEHQATDLPPIKYCEGDRPTDNDIYLGVVGIETPIGIQEMKFPIDALNLQEAFKNFEDSCDEFIKNAENRIIKPTDHDDIILT